MAAQVENDVDLTMEDDGGVNAVLDPNNPGILCVLGSYLGITQLRFEIGVAPAPQ